MKLHTIQWERKGEAGAFGTMRLRSYHRELVDVLFPKNLIAFRVKRGGDHRWVPRQSGRRRRGAHNKFQEWVRGV